ncbi:MAG TPA: roadblock/LC7 domain-containing protein [Planctomycetota bacterium]|nr:roadblock/LC7 domain-containing protein [Planctomycetota bacterium]
MNQETGISGSMVITPDGIMVAAALGPGFEEDSMAAFAASLLLSLKRNFSLLKTKGDLRSCSLNAANGKVMFYDMPNSYLVLVSDSDTEIDGNAAPIQEAIRKICNRRIA